MNVLNKYRPEQVLTDDVARRLLAFGIKEGNKLVIENIRITDSKRVLDGWPHVEGLLALAGIDIQKLKHSEGLLEFAPELEFSEFDGSPTRSSRSAVAFKLAAVEKIAGMSYETAQRRSRSDDMILSR